MNVRTLFCVFVALIGIVSCQDAPNFEDSLKQLGDQVPDLKNFNQSNINLDDIEKALKEKCEKRGAPNAVELLKDEANRAKECIEKYINATQIGAELEVAQKAGLMDEVFAKYCNKWPLIYACIDNVTLYMRQCMDNKEEEIFNKTLDIIKELKEFMCFKDGDRLALFVTQDGLKCIEEQQEGVEKCFNEAIGATLPSIDDFPPSSLLALAFPVRDCAEIDKLRYCVKVELKKCEDSTPANIVDAFFRFLKKQMACKDKKIVLVLH